MQDKRGDKTWTKAERWEVEDGVADFLYGLVRAVKPELVLDLGTFKGKSAAAMTRGLLKNGSGRLITVDKEGLDRDKWPEEFQNERVVVWTAKTPEAIGLMKLDGLELAFLDTDHAYDTVLGELEAVDERLEPGGYIAVHDSLYPDHSWSVLSACDQFLHDHRNYAAVNIGSYAGVFLMQKYLVGGSFVWSTIAFDEAVQDVLG